MSFLNRLFSTAPKSEPFTVYSPVEGEIIALKEFPDPVFSEGVLGLGCGIIPSGEQITAPFSGTVIQLPDTVHAIGLKSGDGIELLIHIGVDTVAMEGKGFVASVKKGQKVHTGETLISFDRQAIRAANHPDTIAVVVTNADEFAAVRVLKYGRLIGGDALLKTDKK